MNTIIVILTIILLVFSTAFFISGLKGYLPARAKRQVELMHKRLDHDYYFPISVIIEADDYPFSYINNILAQDYKLFEVIMTASTYNSDKVNRLIENFTLKEDNNRPIRYYEKCLHPSAIYRGRKESIPLTLLVFDDQTTRENVAGNPDHVASVPASEMPYLKACISASRMPYIALYKEHSPKIIPTSTLKELAMAALADCNAQNITMYGMSLYNKGEYTSLASGKFE